MQIIKSVSIVFFLCILFVFPCYSQKDVLGWQEARWGMSEKELQATFKAELVKLPKRQKFSKAYVDHTIEDYQIEGRKYTVFFQMDDETNRLSQILIRLNDGSEISAKYIFQWP